MTQAAVLAGLRSMTNEFKNGDEAYGIDGRHQVLLPYFEEAESKGRAEDVGEGIAKTLGILLREKFGSLPKWTQERIQRGRLTQMRQWAKTAIAADSLDGVLGPR